MKDGIFNCFSIYYNKNYGLIIQFNVKLTLHNCKSPRIAITALRGLDILKSKCQRQDIRKKIHGGFAITAKLPAT